MSIALNKRLLVIILVLLSLVVTTLIIMHAAIPGLWHQFLLINPNIINRYG